MKEQKLYERTIGSACNTDCIQYRQGTCPYRYNMKLECSRFIVHYEHLKDNPSEGEPYL